MFVGIYISIYQYKVLVYITYLYTAYSVSIQLPLTTNFYYIRYYIYSRLIRLSELYTISYRRVLISIPTIVLDELVLDSCLLPRLKSLKVSIRTTKYLEQIRITRYLEQTTSIEIQVSIQSILETRTPLIKSRLYLKQASQYNKLLINVDLELTAIPT